MCSVRFRCSRSMIIGISGIDCIKPTVGWAKRSVPTTAEPNRYRSGGHASLCPPYGADEFGRKRNIRLLPPCKQSFLAEVAQHIEARFHKLSSQDHTFSSGGLICRNEYSRAMS